MLTQPQLANHLGIFYTTNTKLLVPAQQTLEQQIVECWNLFSVAAGQGRHEDACQWLNEMGKLEVQLQQ